MTESPEARTPAWTDLVCARVLHDLVGPVGAINNGIELLEELGATSDALALIGDSARQTSDRLKLFRLAYGAGGYASAATVPALWAMVTPVLAEKRVQAEPLPPTLGAALPPALARPGIAKTVALAAIALGDTALRGGRLTFDPGGVEAVCALSIRAERLMPEALAGIDLDSVRPVSERAVPARLAQEVAAALGLLWSRSDTPGVLTLTLTEDPASAAKFIASI